MRDYKLRLYGVVTGGGTGGHIFPALAIREALLKRDVDMLYIGSKNGLEARIIGDEVKSLFLDLRGVKGKRVKEAVIGLFLALKAFFSLLFKFLKERPSFVVGTGGFVCFPALLAGFFCRSKIFLQEQNAVPGATITLLAPLARQVFVGFEEAKEYLPKKKTVYSGNPLREDFYKCPRSYSPHKRGERMIVLVLGGSQGANFINKVVLDALPFLNRESFYFIHQTGEKNRDQIAEQYKEKGFDAEVFSFSHELYKYYFKSHLVIARAGAMTVTEIIASLRPAILIPFPFAIYDHQRKNAEVISKVGGGKVFLEREIDGSSLANLLTEFYMNPNLLSDMAKNLSVIKFINAADFIAERILEEVNCTKKI